MMEGVNSSMMYCKNFYKCHIVPLGITIKKEINLLQYILKIMMMYHLCY
jgi:hypothetical protein